MGIDLKVQLQKPLVLNEADNTDWHLLQGDSDVRVEVRRWAGPLAFPQLPRTPSGAVGQPLAHLVLAREENMIHLISSLCALPGEVGHGWEDPGLSENIRKWPGFMTSVVYRENVRKKWSCGDLRRGPTCSN